MAITEEMQIKKMRYEILNDMSDESKDEIFKLKLADAKLIYLSLVYPFHQAIDELPNDRARNWQTKCAIELYNNIGNNDRVVSYSENGIQETLTSGLSTTLLQELPPAKAGVLC